MLSDSCVFASNDLKIAHHIRNSLLGCRAKRFIKINRYAKCLKTFLSAVLNQLMVDWSL